VQELWCKGYAGGETLSAYSLDASGWVSDAPAATPLTRTERRCNGNVTVTLCGEGREVDAAVAKFLSTWDWAYSPRVESRVVLADGRAVARLFRFANC
jgi:hypothetical protein